MEEGRKWMSGRRRKKGNERRKEKNETGEVSVLRHQFVIGSLLK
jgi:hypothetical protein